MENGCSCASTMSVDQSAVALAFRRSNRSLHVLTQNVPGRLAHVCASLHPQAALEKNRKHSNTEISSKYSIVHTF